MSTQTISENVVNPQNVEQVVTTVAATPDLSIISMIISSDLIGKTVILLLLMASVWSWTIIINKLFSYKDIKAKMKAFESVFWSGQILDDLYERVRRSVDNPLAAIFVNALTESKRHDLKTASASEMLKIGYKERIIQSMHLAKNREIENLEKNLGFLATVGSSATFIGLFGTAWGIMHSFQSIVASKNTTLVAVAPGIAEALLATAIGLFAAIPASVFYNYLTSSIDSICNKADDFIGELTVLLTRAIDENKM